MHVALWRSSDSKYGVKPREIINFNSFLFILSDPAGGAEEIVEDVSINNEYEYENNFKPYSYSKLFSQLSMLAMTPSSSL